MQGVLENVRLLFLYNIAIYGFLISLKLGVTKSVGNEVSFKHVMLYPAYFSRKSTLSFGAVDRRLRRKFSKVEVSF